MSGAYQEFGDRFRYYLNLWTKDELADIVVATFERPARVPRTKAAMLDLIESSLAGNGLERRWNLLSKAEKEIVAEAVHRTNGHYDTRVIKAKYGALPPGMPGNYRRGKKSRLRMFFYLIERYNHDALQIPIELRGRLRQFVPQPPEDRVRTVSSPGETWVLPQRRSSGEERVHADITVSNTEPAARQELIGVLRMVERGQVAVGPKTGRPSVATMRKITKNLYGGDFFDIPKGKLPVNAPGFIRAFAWPLLLQAARLVKINGTKLGLTPKGRKALIAPHHETLKQIWEKWLDTKVIDEFRRIDRIKGQQRRIPRGMTAVSHRRSDIELILLQCPTDGWIAITEFSRFMKATGVNFRVTHNPRKLYIGDPNYGSLGYQGYASWSILQERYLLCFLFEYVATLGMVDVAYIPPNHARTDYTKLYEEPGSGYEFLSRYDGLLYFRLNPLGEFCLGLADTYQPRVPQSVARLSVFPDLRVTTCPSRGLSIDEQIWFEAHASAEGDNLWRLAMDKIALEIMNGGDLDSIREFLSSRDKQPLPERVDGLLREAERRARALKPKQRVLLVSCADADTAEHLTTDKNASKFCRKVSDKDLIVLAGKETQFRKAALRLGYPLPYTG